MKFCNIIHFTLKFSLGEITMKSPIILLTILRINLLYSFDMDTYEINQIELTPLHDAIIISDIADIMYEYKNNMNPMLYTSAFSDDESEEDLENLLLQYKHYLDKAHKQHIEYIDKYKGRDTVPQLRGEKFTKVKPVSHTNYKQDFNYFDTKSQTSSFNNNFNIMGHQGSNIFSSKPENDVLSNYNNPKMLLSLPPLLPKTTLTKSIDSSCFCKENQIPCKCQCKQCLISFEPTNKFKNVKNRQKTESNIAINEPAQKSRGNNLNIIIKIDLQLPNTSAPDRYYKPSIQDEFQETMPKEFISTIRLPFPYFNMPSLIHLNKYDPASDDSSPVHKITIHKKKKTRLNNNNKRHKSKKNITFHSYNNPNLQIKDIEKPIINVESIKNYTFSNNETTDVILGNVSHSDYDINKTNMNTFSDRTNKMSLNYEGVNINSTKLKNINITYEMHKNENSIERDPEKIASLTTLGPLRTKRDVHSSITISPNNESYLVIIKEVKKYDKMFDSDLLYWPESDQNSSTIPLNNITALILDKETKKAKLNLTDNIINTNRTLVLERAIFGDIDWNDIDSVVPVFMSFVGKYFRGVLTFCSQNVCHSMKCAKETCIHRICPPDRRHNGNGHCMGNNKTDGVATMESFMDLPSNITFEVVEILQNRLLGNLYGKATLCIHSKCCTFAANKKKMFKSNCTLKESLLTGHCSNTKKNINVLHKQS